MRESQVTAKTSKRRTELNYKVLEFFATHPRSTKEECIEHLVDGKRCERCW